MFGLFLYSIVCLGAAGLLVLIRGMFTKVGSMGESPNAARLVFTWLVMLALPYGWVEGQTMMHKHEFAEAVHEIEEKGLVTGEAHYYKVQNAMGEHARVILVTTGDLSWGGTYRNVYAVHLERNGTSWAVSAIDPVNTTDGDSAGFTFPPYW